MKKALYRTVRGLRVKPARNGAQMSPAVWRSSQTETHCNECWERYELGGDVFVSPCFFLNRLPVVHERANLVSRARCHVSTLAHLLNQHAI